MRTYTQEGQEKKTSSVNTIYGLKMDAASNGKMRSRAGADWARQVAENHPILRCTQERRRQFWRDRQLATVFYALTCAHGVYGRHSKKESWLLWCLLQEEWLKFFELRLFGTCWLCPSKANFSESEPFLLQTKIFRPPDWIQNCSALQRSQLRFSVCMCRTSL